MADETSAEETGAVQAPEGEAPATDYDSPWKEALRRYLRLFLAMFFPAVHDDIDWTRAYEILDKELQQIAPDAETGRRVVDVLVKVWRLSGEERWVLIHIEVQAQRDAGLPAADVRRTISAPFDRLRRAGRQFAVLADDEPAWRPDRLNATSLWGCGGEFRFPAVKLLDLASDEARLEKSDNPFAVVVLAAPERRSRPPATRNGRRAWKVRLMKGLYGRGLDAEGRPGAAAADRLVPSLCRRNDDRLSRARSGRVREGEADALCRELGTAGQGGGRGRGRGQGRGQGTENRHRLGA